jgi:hypothetical protein
VTDHDDTEAQYQRQCDLFATGTISLAGVALLAVALVVAYHVLRYLTH